MQGRLILISGVSGAGKTTLIAQALKSIPNLRYLKTYTTRPMREGEEGGHEYEFVNAATYAELQKNSTAWDHTEYKGYSYGADIEQAKSMLAQGSTLICSVAPDQGIINEMKRLYGTEIVTVWIEVPTHVAAERISTDEIRKNRNETDTIKDHFNYIFRSTGILRTDKQDFTKLMQQLSK